MYRLSKYTLMYVNSFSENRRSVFFFQFHDNIHVLSRNFSNENICVFCPRAIYFGRPINITYFIFFWKRQGFTVKSQTSGWPVLNMFLLFANALQLYNSSTCMFTSINCKQTLIYLSK